MKQARCLSIALIISLLCIFYQQVKYLDEYSILLKKGSIQSKNKKNMEHSNADLREKKNASEKKEKDEKAKKKKMIEQKKKSACVGLPNNAFRNEMATLLYAQVVSKTVNNFVNFAKVVRLTDLINQLVKAQLGAILEAFQRSL